MRAISISLLLTSLQVIPNILMERELLFGRLSVVEVLQKIGFYLDATGRPQVFAYLAIGWTVLNWIVVPITSRWGQVGFVGGYSVHVVVGNIAVIVVLLRLIPDAHLWRRVRAPLVGCGVIALVGHHLLAASGPLTLTGIILLLLALYLGLVYLLDGAALRDAVAIVPDGDDEAAL